MIALKDTEWYLCATRLFKTTVTLLYQGVAFIPSGYSRVASEIVVLKDR
jgi:hypothetical protein